MTKKQLTLITSLTTAILILGLLISQRMWFRLDLTANRIYTISRVSRRLHTEISEQVQITYYVSDKLSSMNPMPGQIIDLLRVYASYSRGKIRVSVRDPVKAGMASIIEELGIQPHQMEDPSGASVSLVYTGIIIEYLDETDVLPVVFSLDTLEYDLTSRIRALVRGIKREVGVIIGNTEKQWSQDYQHLQQILYMTGYNAIYITQGEEIPASLPALFVFGGAEDLDEWALYRIDHYIQNGGKVLFAAEAVSVNSQGQGEPRVIMDKGLLSMISFYGATIKPALVLDRANLNLSLQTPTSFGIPMVERVRYPLWINILEDNGNRNITLTANFNGLDLFWANPIELNPPESINAETLFTTSSEAWLMTRDFNIDPRASAYLFEREAPDTRGTKIMGAALTGIFPSYFEGLPKPTREWSFADLPDMPLEPKETRIIVIGNTEFASNAFNFVGGIRNFNFLVSVADWLGNDDDIVAIRTRQGQHRLDRIVDDKKREQAIIFAQLVNVVFVPLTVIGVGIFVTLRRRIKAKSAV